MYVKGICVHIEWTCTQIHYTTCTWQEKLHWLYPLLFFIVQQNKNGKTKKSKFVVGLSCRSKMQENTHFANLYVPVTAATVLKEKPASVSAAVQAFYYRDPVDLKASTV